MLVSLFENKRSKVLIVALMNIMMPGSRCSANMSGIIWARRRIRVARRLSPDKKSGTG